MILPQNSFHYAGRRQQRGAAPRITRVLYGCYVGVIWVLYTALLVKVGTHEGYFDIFTLICFIRFASTSPICSCVCATLCVRDLRCTKRTPTHIAEQTHTLSCTQTHIRTHSHKEAHTISSSITLERSMCALQISSSSTRCNGGVT
jgi:hypothetical protein